MLLQFLDINWRMVIVKTMPILKEHIDQANLVFQSEKSYVVLIYDQTSFHLLPASSSLHYFLNKALNDQRSVFVGQMYKTFVLSKKQELHQESLAEWADGEFDFDVQKPALPPTHVIFGISPSSKYTYNNVPACNCVLLLCTEQ